MHHVCTMHGYRLTMLTCITFASGFAGEPAASSQQEAKASPTTPTPPAGAEGAHQAQVGKQASKKQSSRVDAVAQKIKLNKGLKHEDDLTAEVSSSLPNGT